MVIKYGFKAYGEMHFITAEKAFNCNYEDWKNPKSISP